MHGAMNLTEAELKDRIRRVEGTLAKTPVPEKLGLCNTLCEVLAYDALKSIASGNGGRELANSVLQQIEEVFADCLVETGNLDKKG